MILVVFWLFFFIKKKLKNKDLFIWFGIFWSFKNSLGVLKTV
jgi:hypothetical protein